MATLTSKNLFVGYSTVANADNRHLTDLKLVEQDLLNHFNTRRGERVMMPTFGCRIWEYMYEPFDQTTVDSIKYEVQQVIDNDPRVTMQNMNVIEFENGIRIEMNLFYSPLNAYSNWFINFDRRSQTMTQGYL
jgi:phage baseplate assembly protein W